MSQKNPIRKFWRFTLPLVLVTYSVACTHLPSGEKAFDSFESCFAANLGLAAVGGVGIGVLGSKLVGDLTGSRSTGKTAGVAMGLAASTMIAMHAWKKCAAVYNKSELVSTAAPASTQPAATLTPATASTAEVTRQTPQLNINRLEVRVEGTENDPPQPEFDFSLVTADPAARDIKARFRHKVEVVRFKATDDDRLILADDRDQALLDKSGKEIPLEAAARMPRERLSWVTIAEDGKEDYLEEVVVQPGTRLKYRHKLQVPPRDKLPVPLPLPMRYTLTIEAEEMKSGRNVDFAILPTAQRPKHYAASPQAGALRSLHSEAAPQALTETATTNRQTSLYSHWGKPRKTVITLNKGATLQVEERSIQTTDGKSVEWVRVATKRGMRGWLPASHLSGAQ